MHNSKKWARILCAAMCLLLVFALLATTFLPLFM